MLEFSAFTPTYPIHAMKSSLLAALMLAAVLQACAVNMHHGTRVTEAQTMTFEVGVTTQDDVIAALGKPSWSTVYPSGEKSIAYMSSTSRINPPSPATLSGAKPRTELVGVETTGFIFDANSKLVKIIRTPASAASGTPPPAGEGAAKQPTQP